MKKIAMPSGRLVQIGLAIGLAAVCLALLAGLGLSDPMIAQAEAVDNARVNMVVLGQPQIDAMASTATATTVGQGTFAGAGSVAPTSFATINVAGSAQVTTTIRLTTTTTGPVTVTVTGSVPVTVTAPISVNVTNAIYVSGTAKVGGVVVIDEEIQVNGPGTVQQEIIESVNLNGTVQVFNSGGSTQTAIVTGSGPTTGSATLSATEPQSDLKKYLPVVNKNPGFYDDFSSYAAGIWPQGSSGKCEVSYSSGRYRMKVNDGWSGSAYECVVITRSPCFQPIGTIGIDARRTSSEDYELWYGMYFSVGSDYTKDRWAVQVRPDRVLCDGSDRPYFWLNCLEDGVACWGNKYKCGADINIEQDEWNEIDVTRDGDVATVFINGGEQMTKTSGALKSKGYFNLFAYSQDKNHDIVVEFDDFYAVPQVLDID